MDKTKRGRHKWTGKDLKPSVSWLERLRGVKKIVLANHRPYHHRFPSGHLIIVKNTDSGFKLRGYASDGFRDMFVVLCNSNCRDIVKQAIQEKFPN